jgi:hypothetical protein
MRVRLKFINQVNAAGPAKPKSLIAFSTASTLRSCDCGGTPNHQCHDVQLVAGPSLGNAAASQIRIGPARMGRPRAHPKPERPPSTSTWHSPADTGGAGIIWLDRLGTTPVREAG